MKVSFVTTLFVTGFALTVVGFVMIVAASLLTRSRRSKHVRRDFGGVVLIGPFPIIFGSSRRTVRLMIVVAAVFIALTLLLSILPLLTGV